MSVSRATLIVGPAKIDWSGTTLFTPDTFKINPRLSLDDVRSDMHGLVDSTLSDVVYDVSFTPLGIWAWRSVLFPYLGTASAGTEFTPGTSIITTSDVPLVITAKHQDAEGTNIYTIKAAGITKMPDIFLGPTRQFFGPVTFTGVIANNTNPEAADAFIAQSSGAYADTTFSASSIVKQRYSASWGSAAGFGSFQAQDFWTISCELATAPVRVQGYTRDIKFETMRFMARCVPVGPTTKNIQDAALFQGSAQFPSPAGVEGRRQSASAGTLQITGGSGATAVSVKLQNAMLRTSGYVFGSSGAPLRYDEIGFETTIVQSSGANVSQMILA